MENVFLFWAPDKEWVVSEGRIRWRMFTYFGLWIRNGLSGSWEPVENVFIFWAPDKECIVWELGASGYISYFGLQIRNGLSGSLESGGECFHILGSG